jgi:hypothetical protein
MTRLANSQEHPRDELDGEECDAKIYYLEVLYSVGILGTSYLLQALSGPLTSHPEVR